MHKRFLLTLLCVLALTLSGFAAHKSKKTTPPPTAPDKAYLQKILDGWSAMNAANMAQYYDQGNYNFFDIAPLKYSNWAEYQKGVTELLKAYKNFKLTLNDDAQIHTDGNLTWTTSHGQGRRAHFRWEARNGGPALDPDLREAGRQVDDRTRTYVGAAASNVLEENRTGHEPSGDAVCSPRPRFWLSYPLLVDVATPALWMLALLFLGRRSPTIEFSTSWAAAGWVLFTAPRTPPWAASSL